MAPSVLPTGPFTFVHQFADPNHWVISYRDSSRSTRRRAAPERTHEERPATHDPAASSRGEHRGRTAVDVPTRKRNQRVSLMNSFDKMYDYQHALRTAETEAQRVCEEGRHYPEVEFRFGTKLFSVKAFMATPPQGDSDFKMRYRVVGSHDAAISRLHLVELLRAEKAHLEGLRELMRGAP